MSLDVIYALQPETMDCDCDDYLIRLGGAKKNRDIDILQFILGPPPKAGV